MAFEDVHDAADDDLGPVERLLGNLRGEVSRAGGQPGYFLDVVVGPVRVLPRIVVGFGPQQFLLALRAIDLPSGLVDIDQLDGHGGGEKRLWVFPEIPADVADALVAQPVDQCLYGGVVFLPYAERRMLYQRAVARLARAQRFLSSLALGDVDDGEKGPRPVVAMGGRDHGADQDENFRLVVFGVGRLEFVARRPRVKGDEGIAEAFELAGGRLRAARFVKERLLARRAVHLDNRAADLGAQAQVIGLDEPIAAPVEVAAQVLDAALGEVVQHRLHGGPVLFPDAARRILENHAITGLTLEQGILALLALGDVLNRVDHARPVAAVLRRHHGPGPDDHLLAVEFPVGMLILKAPTS